MHHQAAHTGLTAMGFGAGSAFTVVPIQNMIKASGYEYTFFWFGIGQGIVVVLVSLLLVAPRPGQVPVVQKLSTGRDVAPMKMLRTPVFWLMYAMFVMMAAGGLMATAQLAPIAKDFNVAGVPVSLSSQCSPAVWRNLPRPIRVARLRPGRIGIMPVRCAPARARAGAATAGNGRDAGLIEVFWPGTSLYMLRPH